MANGDAAAAKGFVPVQSTDDIRLGYDGINRAADLAAILTKIDDTTLNSTTTTIYSQLIRRVLGRVNVDIAFGNFSTGQVIGVIPNGFAPPNGHIIVIPINTGNAWDQSTRFVIDTNGSVRHYDGPTGVGGQVHTQYGL